MACLRLKRRRRSHSRRRRTPTLIIFEDYGITALQLLPLAYRPDNVGDLSKTFLYHLVKVINQSRDAHYTRTIIELTCKETQAAQPLINMTRVNVADLISIQKRCKQGGLKRKLEQETSDREAADDLDSEDSGVETSDVKRRRSNGGASSVAGGGAEITSAHHNAEKVKTDG